MIIFWNFLKRQVAQIIKGDLLVISNKLKIIYPHLIYFPMYVLSIPFVMIIRLIGPIFLIRWQGICASRIGEFAANLELYLCEKELGLNLPSQFYFDIFFVEHVPICNQQLHLMWKRILRIWPRFIFYPIKVVNKIIPGGDSHEFLPSCRDRDIHNLYDKTLPYLSFTKEEEQRGARILLNLGVPKEGKFVCLMVRDSAYLPDNHYHSYRDGDINNYILAAEELTSRGYFVIRMGAAVNYPIKSQNSRIIDYSTNGARSDFMDIFLGAKCTFCISTSTGIDSIPTIFRKPCVFVTVPVGYIFTFSKNFLSITKHHMSISNRKELSLDEIFDNNVAYALTTDEFKNNGVYLVDNSPEEIRDLVIEMDDRINGNSLDEHKASKSKSIENYLNNLNKDQKNLHGNINSLFGSKFLEKNSSF